MGLAFWAKPHGADLVLEQVAGRAVLESDPYLPLNELGAPEIADWPAPRTPAALAFNAPLAYFDTQTLVRVFTVINVVALVGIFAMSAGPRALALCPLVLASEVGYYMVQLTNFSPLISLGIVGTWFLARRGNRWKYGIPLGLAIALRVYPAAFALALLVGKRRRVGIAALFIGAGLNLMGLLIPSITLQGTIQAFAATSDQMLYVFSNLSLPAVFARYGWLTLGLFLSACVGVGLVAWMFCRRPGYDRGVAVTAPAILLTIPVVWPHYLLAVGPALARSRLLSAVIALWFLPRFAPMAPEIPLAASLILLTVESFTRASQTSSELSGIPSI